MEFREAYYLIALFDVIVDVLYHNFILFDFRMFYGDVH